MDTRLQDLIEQQAQAEGLSVGTSFYTKLDDYLVKYFQDRSEKDQTVIQTYLAQAGLKIAKTEKKQTLEAEDAKAAIYFLHLPGTLDTECQDAGDFALDREAHRGSPEREMLSQHFRQFLDR